MRKTKKNKKKKEELEINDVKEVRTETAKEITGIKLLKRKKFFREMDKIEDILYEAIPDFKWSKIFTKDGNLIWYNQDINVCYPGEIKNYWIELGKPVSEAMNIIKNDNDYQSYGINWNLSTYYDASDSFYRGWHPFQKGHNCNISDSTQISCRSSSERNIIDGFNNSNPTLKSKSGLIIPIFRIVGQWTEDIVLEFIKNNLIPERIKNKKGLSEDYWYLKNYTDYKKYKKCGKYGEIIWNIDAICEGIVRHGVDIFKEATFELTFDNGDKEIVTYIDGIKSGLSKYIYTNGDVEKRTYVKGVLQGEATCRYRDGSVEKRTYVDGELSGEAFLYRDHKLEKPFVYEKGRKMDVTDYSACLNVDKIRVNLDEYDKNILIDPNRGHWDLFDDKQLKLKIQKDTGKTIYDRDPKLDIKDGGIVGIDFGTKSTVVVYQNDNKILPMRISGQRLIKSVEANDYENPTVIQFINLKNFISDYKAKDGRPLTKWKDVTVSHTAFSNFVHGTNEEFYSAISDLKQWAASKNEKLVICDKQNYEYTFNPYLELKDGQIDPIELYAYYIGSYINNMRNGIYLEYFLSFPVTYEKSIREKILQSFERGIKKSLPVSILKDTEVMKQFSVQHGANEPAAYAVCALQEYQFEPDEDEKIYYGVFDFGGGTADFDFGIWRGSKDIRSFDYELEHFGAGGDRYLGGENILKELAYEVFKKNAAKLREDGISFERPEWCEHFAGDELLVNSSREAKLNIKKMMEKLRPIWENSASEISEMGDQIKCSLYTRDGEKGKNIDNISINKENIENIIKEKIESGVKNFFIAMEKAFADEEYEDIVILLAGNSCKHPLVKTKFEEYIEENKIPAKIYPALGTKDAFEILRDKGVEIYQKDENMVNTEKPTGKTGVAYGLLESRTGGRVKIINRDEEANAGNEINFRYYVGFEGRKRLRVVLSPKTKYNSPQYLLNVTAKVFDLYYTTLPEAAKDKLPIEKAQRKRIKLKDNYKDAKIFIQSVRAGVVKYLITQKDIDNKEYLDEGEIELD